MFTYIPISVMKCQTNFLKVCFEKYHLLSQHVSVAENAVRIFQYLHHSAMNNYTVDGSFINAALTFITCPVDTKHRVEIFFI